MPDKENSDIVLEGSKATWTLPPTNGDIAGTYTGQFTFRCYLSPTQELEAGRHYRSLLGPNAILASEHEGQLAFCLTQLKQRIISSPPFWTTFKSDDGVDGNLPDLNVLLNVLDAAMRSEALFKEQAIKERQSTLKSSIETLEARLKEEG